MASELIAEAITDYFGERCLDYAEGCPTCEAWAEYDRLYTSPAPAATDTGLETVAWRERSPTNNYFTYHEYPTPLVREKEELVTRSQAEDIIRYLETKILEAAISDRLDDAGAPLSWQERAEIAEGIISDLKADNAAKDAQIRELRDTSKQMIGNWRNRAETAEAKLDTANALVTCCCGDPVDAHNMGSGHSPVDQYHYAMMQLEAKLAAAEKALETKSAANEALSKSVVESIETEKRLREALELIADIDTRPYRCAAIARAVLGGKPSC